MNRYAIHTHNLCRSFGRLRAVEQVSFAVEKGQVVGLLGANGAGKSTLVRLLTGVLKPSSGEAWVGGFHIIKESRKVKEWTGYMGQTSLLFEDLTVWENIHFYGTVYGLTKRQINTRMAELDNDLGIGRYRDMMARKLSTGWRRALSFSIAILHQPEVVFLDEPSNGLDVLSRRNLWNIIRRSAQGGMTLLVTTHYMDEISNCDRLLLMERGVLSDKGESIYTL